MQVERLPVSELDDGALGAELRRLALGLTVGEARRLRDLLGRDPTVVEASLFDVMWSEHCSYKSSKRLLKLLPTDGSNVVLGPGEDAGIIRLIRHNGRSYCLVMAHESHNHPSQVLPVEGAATGIGGIVRDVYCMGAKVIGVMDALRFGDPTGPFGARSLEIARGVVTGIWQYGNALGVPNLGGDVYFAPCFDDNCLVNVIAIGIVEEDRVIRSRVPEEAGREPYDLVLIGKSTDRSGYKGASFASRVLEGESQDKGAVQVPDPFLKRVLSEATAKALDLAAERGAALGFKDLGAGGISCAFSELASRGGCGARLNLDLVPIDGEPLPPEVIACSETQERYAMAVPRRIVADVLKIYNDDYELPRLYPGAGATVIGSVMPERQFVAEHGGEIVCDSPVEAITAGITAEREVAPKAKGEIKEAPAPPWDLNESLLRVARSLNSCSREWIYSFYDSEVQGKTVVRPGDADASIVLPITGCPLGVAVSVDGNPFYGALDAYWGGATAVAESMRNVACVGASPQALTDCLNYGNPEKPDVFRQFIEGVRGIADAASMLWRKGSDHEPVPIISGNVSFYNESSSGRAVNPSPIVACVGTIEDYSRAVTMDVKREGNVLLMVGQRRGELGGSAYLRTVPGGEGAGSVPTVDFEAERAAIHAVIDCIQAGLVLACHDISEGGFGLCVAEMLLGARGAGRLGVEADLGVLGHDHKPEEILFCEAGGFVLEIIPANVRRALEILDAARASAWPIGRTTSDAKMRFLVFGREVVNLKVKEVADSWTCALPPSW